MTQDSLSVHFLVIFPVKQQLCILSDILQDMFKSFSELYGFKHTVCSPHYPQANGMSENQSKLLNKRLLIKAKRDGADPYLALLAHRNTPRGDLGSPSQRLFSRRTKTLFTNIGEPCVVLNVQTNLMNHRDTQ